MAVTNPSWNVTQADVNALTNQAIPTLQKLLAGMATDARYAGWANTLQGMIDNLTQLVPVVTAYIQVQGS